MPSGGKVESACLFVEDSSKLVILLRFRKYFAEMSDQRLQRAAAGMIWLGETMPARRMFGGDISFPNPSRASFPVYADMGMYDPDSIYWRGSRALGLYWLVFR